MNIKLLFLTILVSLSQIVFSQNEDDTPPALNSITVTPNPVNANEEVTVTVNATDDLSGIHSIQVDLLNPDGEQPHAAFAIIENWEDLGNHNYAYNVLISGLAVAGEWYVSDVYIHDNADNVFHQSSNDGVIATFTVNSILSDSTPPQLNSIMVSPTSLNNNEEVTVTVNATDDLSGINFMQVDLVNPNGEQLHSVFGILENWEDLGENNYASTALISEWAVSGEWYVSAVYIYDALDNLYQQNSDDGEIATFMVNSSTPDDTVPVLNSVIVSPNLVNSNEEVTVTVNVTDDLSGIERIQIDLVNPNGEQKHSAFAIIENWEDLGDNNYAYNVLISEWAVSGEWYVSGVFIHDIAGNLYTQNNTDGEIATFMVNNASLNLDEEKQIDYELYPNPSNSGIFFLSGMSTFERVTVYDSLGRKVIIDENKSQINLSDKPKGLYLLKIENNNKTSYRKLLSK